MGDEQHLTVKTALSTIAENKELSLFSHEIKADDDADCIAGFD